MAVSDVLRHAMAAANQPRGSNGDRTAMRTGPALCFPRPFQLYPNKRARWNGEGKPGTLLPLSRSPVRPCSLLPRSLVVVAISSSRPSPAVFLRPPLSFFIVESFTVRFTGVGAISWAESDESRGYTSRELRMDPHNATNDLSMRLHETRTAVRGKTQQ